MTVYSGISEGAAVWLLAPVACSSYMLSTNIRVLPETILGNEISAVSSQFQRAVQGLCLDLGEDRGLYGRVRSCGMSVKVLTKVEVCVCVCVCECSYTASPNFRLNMASVECNTGLLIPRARRRRLAG